jgi:DivIVA domain-containing protein
VPVFFVLLALAVIAGIALVAAGRGDALLTARPDRPPLKLPTRPLTGADLAELRFAVGLRGYRMDEVDSVLDRLADELAARDAQITALTERVAALSTGSAEAERDHG